MRIFGYARCSTNETKQHIERQLRELKLMGAEFIFWEYASGALINRPELQKMLSLINEGDCILCTEVSRLTRSIKQLLEIIALAQEKQLKLALGTLVLDCTDKINPFTEASLLMAGVFAKLEREMTIDRINSGIATARAKGVRLGRPRKRVKDLPQRVMYYWHKYRNDEINKTEFAKLCGIARTTAYRYIALLTDGE